MLFLVNRKVLTVIRGCFESAGLRWTIAKMLLGSLALHLEKKIKGRVQSPASQAIPSLWACLKVVALWHIPWPAEDTLRQIWHLRVQGLGFWGT